MYFSKKLPKCHWFFFDHRKKNKENSFTTEKVHSENTTYSVNTQQSD